MTTPAAGLPASYPKDTLESSSSARRGGATSSGTRAGLRGRKKKASQECLSTQPPLISRELNEIPLDSSKNSKVDELFNAICPRLVGGGRGGGPPVVRNNISGGTTTYHRTENGNLIKYVMRGPRSAGLW